MISVDYLILKMEEYQAEECGGHQIQLCDNL